MHLSNPKQKGSSRSHIFISYRSIEAEFTLKLAADLRNAGVSIWVDRLDGILGGDDWRRSIQEGLRNAVALIAVLSPEYITSKYCLRELATADELDIPILPLMLRNVPYEQYPIEIRRLQYLNFQEWRDDSFYGQQISELISVIQQKVSAHLGDAPEIETRYLNTLIADLESRRGVLEYVELSAHADLMDTRPEPYFYADDEFGFSELIQRSGQTNQRDIVELGTIHDALIKHPRFVLIGEPGSSKTTSIRRLALEAARNHLKNQTRPLPLFLYLPRWKGEMTIREFIHSEWHKAGLPVHVDPIAMMKSGEILLYMDGLNEMGADGVGKAKEIHSWINSEDSPQNIIVTCRKDNYTDDFDLGLPIVQIEPMNDVHVRQFVENYLGTKAKPLLARILPDNEGAKHDARHLYSLTRNPYMLSALIIVFDTTPNQELPRHNGKLFQMLVRALAKREVKRQTEAWLSLDNQLSRVEDSLARLAFTMIDTEMETEVPLPYACQFLEDNVVRAAQTASYIEVNNGSFRFYHQLIQEYFAAVELGKRGVKHALKPPEYRDEGFMFSRPLEKKWDRVILALADIERKDELIREIMDIDPVLAAVCVGSGAPVSDKLVEEIVYYHLNRLGDEVSNQLMGAVTALSNLGKIASPHLINILNNDDDSFARTGAALVLQTTRDITAVPALISRLTDTESGWYFGVMVCDYAEGALLSIATTEAREAVDKWAEMLLPQLSSDDANIRGRAAMKLGRIGNPIAVPTLISLLSDSSDTDYFIHNERVCDYAAKALQEIGTAESIAAVKKWQKQQK